MNNKEYDVIVVGELNVDIILNDIDSFPEMGKEKLAGKMDTTLGSSSAILASNLSSLGAKVAFIGKIGQDQNGEIVLNSFQNKGVETGMIIRSEKYNTGATIVLNFEEDRANITYPGAMDHLGFDDIQDELLSKAKHMHFSTLFMQPGIKPDIGKLFKKAKSLGLTTSLDPQWDPAEKWDFDYASILPYVDIFLPNETELKFIAGTKTIEEAVLAVKDYVNILVVKNGSKGSTVYHKGQAEHKESFLNKSVVDAIGAGDSFNSGFIFKFVQKNQIPECQVFGNLMGAVNTTKSGGTTAFDNFDSIMEIARIKFGY